MMRTKHIGQTETWLYHVFTSSFGPMTVCNMGTSQQNIWNIRRQKAHSDPLKLYLDLLRLEVFCFLLIYVSLTPRKPVVECKFCIVHMHVCYSSLVFFSSCLYGHIATLPHALLSPAADEWKGSKTSGDTFCISTSFLSSCACVSFCVLFTTAKNIKCSCNKKVFHKTNFCALRLWLW